MSESLSFVDSLIVTVIGLVIVFLGLAILIGLIKLLVMITENIGKPKAAKTAAPAPAAPAPAPVEEAAAESDDALIAVITAAVACMMDEGTAFTVRRVRRVNTAPAWNRAGREEQIYSRM